MNRYLPLIEQAINDLSYPSEPSLLYAPISYTMSLGGKRIRPVLTLMTCDALGGKAEEALEAALAIELYHNFTLLHDDVMDRAEVRRGKPTVHSKWNDNVAILSGDTMLTIALRHALQSPPRCRERVAKLLIDTAIEVYEGQQYDMDFERRDDVMQEEYIEMIRLKTSVLLGCACRAGAIVAGAGDAREAALYDMGVELGLAFQLQDDYLDVWGDEATFGKEIGGDISNNKKTFLLINAQSRAEGHTAEELKKWLATTEKSSGKIAAVTRIYEQLGLKQLAAQAIAHHSAKAVEHLQRAGLTAAAQKPFEQLIDKLTRRTH